MQDYLKGKFNHSVDAKGRLIIPAKLRDGLGSSFVLTEGADGCLNGYSKEVWNAKAEQIMSLPSNNPKVRELQRKFNHLGTDVDLDAQGRIVIPAELRERAGIIKEVVVAGNGDKIEVWSKERYVELFDKVTSITDLLQDISELGLNINL